MGHIEVRPLGYALGAEVSGIDLSQPLSAADRQTVNDAWLRHLVLVFPGQEKLTPEGHIAFSRNFGALDEHGSQPPAYLHPDHREILMVTNRLIEGKPSGTRNTGRNWHTDLTYTTSPAKGALLLCRERPPVGGDTLFANLTLAYETLSAPMREFVGKLEAVHDASLIKGIEQRDPAQVADLKRRNPPVAHRAVRTHEETGRQSLLLGQRVRGFVGLSDEESKALLDFLNTHATSPEFVYRHRWSVGDVVMWDNRCTQHLALPDFDQTKPRMMLRCSLRGEAVGRVMAAPVVADRESLLQAVAAAA
jgi:taurine dioxygenase